MAASTSELPREPLFQETAQLGSRFELRNRVELLEGRRECIGQAPQSPRTELLVPRLVSANSERGELSH
jgi:hypothetical protein